jgi:hypothetical protein
MNGSFADNVVNSALRYRAQAPLIDQMLKEIGMDGSDINKLTKSLAQPSPPAIEKKE